jgi:hypothetical protein
MGWIGQSCEAKKIRKARYPRQRKAKARVALTARDLMRFLFTETSYTGLGWDATIFLDFFSEWRKGPDLLGIFDGIGAT